MEELLEWFEKEYRKEGRGEPFEGEIVDTLECLYGTEKNDDGEIEGWLVDRNRIKLCRITEKQFELIKNFTLKGV